MTFNFSQANRVERNVQPPMAEAITIPVMVDGKDSGICLYIARGAFARPSSIDVRNVAKQLAECIAGSSKED